MIIEVVKKNSTDSGWDYIPDPKLREELKLKLNGLESTLGGIHIRTCEALGKEPLKDLVIRIARTESPKTGFAFILARDVRLGNPGSNCPDMFLGYAGDIEEFLQTFIHEVIHLTKWDEEQVENKALEIYHSLLRINKELKDG